ncbi:hypothetical protein [Kingella oralis]
MSLRGYVFGFSSKFVPYAAFRLKSLQNLQPMERRRLADILPINKTMLN